MLTVDLLMTVYPFGIKAPAVEGWWYFGIAGEVVAHRAMFNQLGFEIDDIQVLDVTVQVSRRFESSNFPLQACPEIIRSYVPIVKGDAILISANQNEPARSLVGVIANLPLLNEIEEPVQRGKRACWVAVAVSVVNQLVPAIRDDDIGSGAQFGRLPPKTCQSSTTACTGECD